MLSSMNVQSNEGIYGYRCCQCQHFLITLGRGARFCVKLISVCLLTYLRNHAVERYHFFPYCLWSVLARSSSWSIGGEGGAAPAAPL